MSNANTVAKVFGIVVAVAGLCLAASIGLTQKPAPAQRPKPKPASAPKPAPKGNAPRSPLSPDEALKRFVLHPKLRIELVACEPQVVDPVAIAFDEDGRMWVVEMRDYPNGPNENPQAGDDGGKAKPAGLSRIRVLEDRNNDGRFETATTFADDLLFATGIQPWRGGVVVTLAGEVAYFKDTNGDGQADLRETWFTGFAEKNPQLRANHPTFALDNRIYVANGLRGGDVVARREQWANGDRPLSISGMDFRFDPHTGDYEAVSGPGQFGMTFDDFGNRFVCSNRNPCRHVVLEDRYLKRNPYLAVKNVLHDVSPAGDASRVFPISEAWTTSNLHAGQFTAACGATIYRGDLLPNEFRGNSFVCEPTGNLVHRDVLKPDGPTFTSTPGRKGVEFLATQDEWFRPVNLANGPDGALYVVDMYRAVIEHPEWVPDELKNRPDERFGDDRGRIYRIVPADAANDRRRPAAVLSRASTAGLVKLLEDPTGWRRATAARLLYERRDEAAVPQLAALARSGKTAVARVHALWALRGLDALDAKIVKAALIDPHPRVREHALRLSEDWFEPGDSLHARAARIALDDDPRTRFQAALSAGALKTEHWRSTALWNVAVFDADDEWTRSAIVSSSAESPHGILKGLLEALFVRMKSGLETGDKPARRFLVADLAENAAARNEKSAVPQTLSALLALRVGELKGDLQPAARRLQLAGLQGTARGLRRHGKRISQYLGELPAAESRQIASLLAEIVRIAGSADEPIELRREVVPLLRHAERDAAAGVLRTLALEEKDQSLRLAAISVLSAFPAGETDGRLLIRFAFQTPEVKRAILDLALSDVQRTRALLDAIDQKHISANELDPSRVRRLTRHRNAGVRNRAKKLLAAAIPAERKQVLADYRQALSLKADASRGRDVFKKNCTACHRIGDLGVNVAPDVSDSRTKTPAQLLVSILDPNRAIDNNYVSYTAVTVDGKVHTGVIATETASSVALRQPENKIVTLLRKDVETLKSNGVSLMPVGLEKNITPQQMADLIAFIKNWRYLDGRTPVPGGKSAGDSDSKPE